MQQIICISPENIPVIDSRLMSQRLDVRHRDIMRDILDKYSDDFLEFGGFARLLAKPKGDQGGRPQAYYLLNEDQCYLLLTYIKNTPKARKLKKELVKSFKEARRQLAIKDQARIEGKKIRHQETDSIKQLVEYAKGQGSKSAEMYYANVTKMTNKALNISPGWREKLPAHALKQLSVAETIVDLAIRDGIRAGLGYKDIYKLAKQRVADSLQSIGIEGGEK